MRPQLPDGARELIADRGYDSTRFRDALIARGIAPCIPTTRSRKCPISHEATLYKQRYRVEIMFGRLKDWRRIAMRHAPCAMRHAPCAMRHDRCAHTFFSAIALAATITFWLGR